MLHAEHRRGAGCVIVNEIPPGFPHPRLVFSPQFPPAISGWMAIQQFDRVAARGVHSVEQCFHVRQNSARQRGVKRFSVRNRSHWPLRASFAWGCAMACPGDVRVGDSCQAGSAAAMPRKAHQTGRPAIMLPAGASRLRSEWGRLPRGLSLLPNRSPRVPEGHVPAEAWSAGRRTNEGCQQISLPRGGVPIIRHLDSSMAHEG